MGDLENLVLTVFRVVVIKVMMTTEHTEESLKKKPSQLDGLKLKMKIGNGYVRSVQAIKINWIEFLINNHYISYELDKKK